MGYESCDFQWKGSRWREVGERRSSRDRRVDWRRTSTKMKKLGERGKMSLRRERFT